MKSAVVKERQNIGGSMEESLEEKSEKCEHEWETIGKKYSGTRGNAMQKMRKEERGSSSSMIYRRL